MRSGAKREAKRAGVERAEREEGAGPASGLAGPARSGLARGKGEVLRAGPKTGFGLCTGLGWVGHRASWDWVWVLAGFGFCHSISLTFLNLIQTKFEFKFEFEFKPHLNKIMHQHECNKNLNL